MSVTIWASSLSVGEPGGSRHHDPDGNNDERGDPSYQPGSPVQCLLEFAAHGCTSGDGSGVGGMKRLAEAVSPEHAKPRTKHAKNRRLKDDDVVETGTDDP
jgi:hypothetical protein